MHPLPVYVRKYCSFLSQPQKQHIFHHAWFWLVSRTLGIPPDRQLFLDHSWGNSLVPCGHTQGFSPVWKYCGCFPSVLARFSSKFSRWNPSFTQPVGEGPEDIIKSCDGEKGRSVKNLRTAGGSFQDQRMVVFKVSECKTPCRSPPGFSRGEGVVFLKVRGQTHSNSTQFDSPHLPPWGLIKKTYCRGGAGRFSSDKAKPIGQFRFMSPAESEFQEMRDLFFVL